MALISDETLTFMATVKESLARCRRKARSLFCVVYNGGHELYRARTDTKLYQQCLLCGHETHGWTIERRDRRLHLVSTAAAPIKKAS